MNSNTRRESGWGRASLGLLMFFLLAADILSIFVGKWLDGRPLSDPAIWSTHWTATIGTFLCSVAIWSAAVLLVVWRARRRGTLTALFSLRLDRRAVALCGVGLLAVVALKWLEASGSGAAFPAVLREYRGFEHRYVGHGATVTAFQYLYYLLESMMVLLIIAFFQRAGELWTRLSSIPWGALGLTLTWGLAHFASHPAGALTVVMSALLFGFVFLGARKSVVPALVTIYFAFVL